MDIQALVQSLKDDLKAGRSCLAKQYRQKGDAYGYLLQHAQKVDHILSQLWQHLDMPPELALTAVGGYGRGELYPHSDVDLLILLPHDPDPPLIARLEQLVGIFWDIGLEAGHSTRTVADCLREASGEITIQTALLENRLIVGNAALHQELAASFSRHMQPRVFFQAKSLEQEERYHRYQDTLYSLEPNCKESPGGLRDLHVILWLCRACGYGVGWESMRESGILTREGQRQIERRESWLRHLRIQLHLLVGRREDRLLFDHQEALAKLMLVEASPGKRASEKFMQTYYRNAKMIAQFNTVMRQSIETDLTPEDEAPALSPLNQHFQARGNFLDIRHEKVFSEYPGALLECFQLLQEHPELHGMTARTHRSLWRGRKLITADFQADAKNRRLFLSLFQKNQGVTNAFSHMNQYGILGRYLPAFGKIVGQMQHDLFHAYTVDQHILMVLRNLRRFAQEEFAHEYPYCSRLLNAFPRPWVLYIAALFHDIAKGRGGDHSLLGMEDAREFCETHGLDQEDTELIVWLVKEHLSMSRTAQKEDLSDPAVISAFASGIKNPRYLTALYLLTVADIRGTSPKVWNNWKARLLEDLYRLSLSSLEAGDMPGPQGVIQERQAEALRLLRYFALPETVHERLWRQLDTVYFLRHTAEEIAWHTRALHYRTQIDKPVIKARIDNSGNLQVMVYAKDQPDLFLRQAGFFAGVGYTIAEAKIHTTAHNYALNSFMLLNVAENINDKDMLAFIETELARILEHPLPAKTPAGGRLSRQARHFPITPEIHIHADEQNASQYILSLIASDRPGLLFLVAQVLAQHRVTLKTARISTLGDRVEDTFLIGGQLLDKTAYRLKLENDLLEVLRVH